MRNGQNKVRMHKKFLGYFSCFPYMLGGSRRSWLAGGGDQRGSWRMLSGGSLDLLLRNRLRERWTDRKRCCGI